MKKFLLLLSLCLLAMGGRAANPSFANLQEIIVGPDGTTNGVVAAGSTTSGIQEALNALFQTNAVGATPGGGKLVLKRGVFRCSGQITIPNSFPFNLSIEGCGKVASQVLYTSATAQDFIKCANVGSATLNIRIQSVGFLYAADTNRNYIMVLAGINEVYMEDVLFASYQGVAVNGAALVYFSNVPTNALGVVGLKCGQSTDNKFLFNHCSWYGLAGGAWSLGDHTTFIDCFFGGIGIYHTTSHGTVWTAAQDRRLTNGCGIILTGGFEANVVNCQFSTLRVAVSPGGPNTWIINPLFEQCDYNVAILAEDDAGLIQMDAFANNFSVADGLIQANGTISGTPGVPTIIRGSPDNPNSFMRLAYRGSNIFSFSATGGLSYHAENLTKTGNYSLTTDDTGKWVDNVGAGGAVTNTLPAAVPGLHYSFVVDAAQFLTVKASGSGTIRNGASVSAANGIIFSNTAGSTIHIVAISSTKWVVDSIQGTWTLQ